MKVEAYLFFNGRCEEALDFYGKTLGAQVDMLMRFKDSPEPCEPDTLPPDWNDKVMHSAFRIGDTAIMASDGNCVDNSGFKGFSLSIFLPTEADVKRLFAALSEGGQVQMPLEQTFWSPLFGVVVDRFGISWMLGVEQ